MLMMAKCPPLGQKDVSRRLIREGYVVVTGKITPEGVREARSELDRLLRTTRTGRTPSRGSHERIYALFAKTRIVDAVATHRLLLGVLDQVLGHHQLSAPVGVCIGPGEKAQVLHRDDAIYPCLTASAAGGQHDVAAG